VITSITDGIASVNSSTSGYTAGKINGLTADVDAQPVIKVREGFLNAFNDINTATGYGVGLKFTLAAPPPVGITVTFPASFTTNGAGVPTFVAFNSDATFKGTSTKFSSSSTSLTAYYKLTSTSDPTKQEYATINVELTADEDETPLAPFTGTFTVSLWPNGTAFDEEGDLINDSTLIPRYQELLVSGTLMQVVSSTTTLLVPFAQTVTALNYNTGFAIANTTKDPGVLATGLTGPTKQTGGLTFYFFPQLPRGGTTLPASFSYATKAGSPGGGLDASGNLPAGSTYNVLLSELLAAASAPADFVGYVFIVTNFTNAHCLFVVSNFDTFSQGNLALVVADRSAPEALNQ
jgi:hypothetical protein